MKIIKVVLIASILNGCAGIPGDNVKLENYPEISEKNIELNLVYKYNRNKNDKNNNLNFNGVIANKFRLKNSMKASKSSGCEVEILSYTGEGSIFTCPVITNLLSPLTLTILPYYCQYTYHAKATLISTKDNRILKEYDLKDKVHEVWSSLMFLFVLATSQTSMWDNSSIETPETAKRETANKVSEALVRSILNDAQTFEECRK